VIRRLPRGATTAPPVARPGTGYGRAVRTGPPEELREYDTVAEGHRFDPDALLAEPLDATQHA
jgi:hypothetical protein